ncbi:hypothetical protein PSTG_13080 [Puccinia striiformis f. sp. tritici PST-78]|uniref:Uncharacterized protein n=1 Tax=Puccinia striiformis f. sp. tritici PST-78 TaxID=1165861 RepID=A0A0L0V2P9_9BASI|nr:hypothetical protein PSTG_13080 [Puccinia striiformis f. sp. tritici PST-78]
MAIDLAPKSTNPAGGFVHRPRVAPDSCGVQPSRESSRAALGDRLRTRNGGPPIAQIPYTGAFSLSLQPAASDDAAGPNSARATQAIATDTACLDPLDVVDQNVNQWMAHRSYKLTAKILTVRMALRRLSCRII